MNFQRWLAAFLLLAMLLSPAAQAELLESEIKYYIEIVRREAAEESEESK